MLIKSVNVSFSILRAFLGRRSALTLKEIGYQSGLPPSKAHRYLQSLIREGMICQDPRTRLYRLGSAAIALGLEALENTDPVVSACESVRPLAEALDVAISVDVMGQAGPICIWYEQPITHLNAPTRLGAVQTLLGSSAGHVFLAYLPRHATRALAAEEAGRARIAAPDFDTVASQVLARGYAVHHHGPGASMTSISAPVVDARGEACSVITFFTRDVEAGDAGSDIALALLNAANDASALKNYRREMRMAAAV